MAQVVQPDAAELGRRRAGKKTLDRNRRRWSGNTNSGEILLVRSSCSRSAVTTTPGSSTNRRLAGVFSSGHVAGGGFDLLRDAEPPLSQPE